MRPRLLLVALLALSLTAAAQQAGPRILKIDPPNWWAQMPKPMLLVRGEDLTSAQVRLSDPHLRIESTKISENGHWAELWLSASPAHPETITITIKTPQGTTSAPYRFDQKRGENDGVAGFSSADVMYLIMTDRFADGDLTNDGTAAEHAAELAKPRGWHGGDLRGISNHINYLQDLGITTVWITPVYQNHGPQSYHGYGATDMYAVDQHFGSLEDLRSLAENLHKHHLKLVLDTVPNHVGATHEWVYDSPEPTWFHGTLAHHSIAQGNFNPLIDLHAPWRDQRNVTLGWFADTLPDLNQENPAVSKYLIQNVIWWIEKTGSDGLRIDTFPYVARSFWHDFHTAIHGLYPHLTTVGEIFNRDPVVVSSFAGHVTRTSAEGGIDTGLDTPFDFPTYFALRSVFIEGGPMSKLGDVLRLDSLYPHPERLVPFLGNHDTMRFMSEPSATTRRLQLALSVLTTMRGMPQIYSGDEIAIPGAEDPDNRRDFPGGFAPTRDDAFSPEGRAPEQQQTYTSLQTLLSLRRSHPALQTGQEELLRADGDVLVYVRTLKGREQGTQRILVAVNKGQQSEVVALRTEGTTLEDVHGGSILSGDPDALSFSAGTVTLRIAAETALIVDVK